MIPIYYKSTIVEKIDPNVIPAPWWAYVVLTTVIVLIAAMIFIISLFLVSIVSDWFDGQPLREVLHDRVKFIKELRWK